MIVFHGKEPGKGDLDSLDELRIAGPQTESVPSTERLTLNLTDLGHISLPLLCQLYRQFLANQINTTWVRKSGTEYSIFFYLNIPMLKFLVIVHFCKFSFLPH